MMGRSSVDHRSDIRALLRVCNVHNVPVATNLATADLIIEALCALGAPPDHPRERPS
jgi:methylglyoxal synthase